MIKKRAQAWGFDLIIAVSIFIIGIVIFFLFALNLNESEDDTLNIMEYEGNTIADNLLSDGLPNNWNTTNVAKIGILSDNKVNNTKLEFFYNLSQTDYQRTKSLFSTNYEYFINFSEPIMINDVQIQGIGLPFTNQSNLIKINRFVVYNNKPITAYTYIWN